MMRGKAKKAFLLSAAFFLCASDKSSWASSSNRNTTLAIPPSQINSNSSFSSNAHLVAVAPSGATPLDYGPLIGGNPASTSVQSEAQVAVAVGAAINNLGFLTWASQLPQWAEQFTNLMAGAAAGHPNVQVAISPSEDSASWAMAVVAPQVTTSDQERAALGSSSVQDLHQQNKLTWQDLEGELESERADLQGREVQIQMEVNREQVEDAGREAQSASDKASQAADRAVQIAQEALTTTSGNPVAAVDAVKAAHAAEEAIASAHQAEQLLKAAMDAYQQADQQGEQTLKTLQSQLVAAPPEVQKKLSGLLTQRRAQVESSLAQASQKIDQAAQATQEAEEAAQRAATAAKLIVPQSAGLWTRIKNGFANLGHAFRNPGEYAIQLSELAKGGAKVTLGAALAAAATMSEGAPVLGQLLTPLNAAAFITGSGIAASGVYDMGNALKTMWQGKNQWQALAYQDAAANVQHAAQSLGSQLQVAKAHLEKLGVDPNNPLLQMAGDRNKAAEKIFQDAVRAAAQNGSLDKFYKSVDAAIAQLSSSITDLKTGSAQIGKTFRGFDGLLHSLYRSTGRGDKAYHDVLGQLVEFSDIEKQARQYQDEFQATLNTPEKQASYQSYLGLEKGYQVAVRSASAWQALADKARPEIYAQTLAQSMVGVEGWDLGFGGMASAIGRDVMGSSTYLYKGIEALAGYDLGKTIQLFGGNAFGLRASSIGEYANDPIYQGISQLFGTPVNGLTAISSELGIHGARGNSAALQSWMDNQQVLQSRNGINLSGLNQMGFSKEGSNFAYLAARDGGLWALADLGLMGMYQVAGTIPTLVGIGSMMGVAGPELGNGIAGGLQYWGASQMAASMIGNVVSGTLGQAIAIPFMKQYGTKALDLTGKVLAHFEDGYTFTRNDWANLYETVGQAVSFAVAQETVHGIEIASGPAGADNSVSLKDFAVHFVPDVGQNSANLLAQFAATGAFGGSTAAAWSVVGGESALNVLLSAREKSDQQTAQNEKAADPPRPEDNVALPVQTQAALKDGIDAAKPQTYGFVKDAPILGYRITSENFADLPEAIQKQLGLVDQTAYAADYLKDKVGSIVVLQMNGSTPDFYPIGMDSFQKYQIVSVSEVGAKNAKLMKGLMAVDGIEGLVNSDVSNLVGALKTVPVEMFKMSDVGYPINQEITIQSPWGTQTKPAGKDAYLVWDKTKEQYYMVNTDASGLPISYVTTPAH